MTVNEFVLLVENKQKRSISFSKINVRVDCLLRILKKRKITKMAMSSQSDRNQTNRLRVGSDNTEIQCQKCDKIVKEKIECSGCKLDYCIYCINVTPHLLVFELIQKGELEDFMWTCRSCRATFPSLENISCVLKDIQKNADQRIESLESYMTNVETITEEAIKDSVENMKSEVIVSLLLMQDPKRLKTERGEKVTWCCLICPNTEPQAEMKTKKRNEANFIRLSHSLGLENPEVMICFRLGRKHETQNRPLKIVLANKSHRMYLLDNAKTLPEKAPTYMKDVIISRDLTPEQRKE